MKIHYIMPTICTLLIPVQVVLSILAPRLGVLLAGALHVLLTILMWLIALRTDARSRRDAVAFATDSNVRLMACKRLRG